LSGDGALLFLETDLMFLGSIFVMSERKIGKGSDEKDV
jgi:hypothetical protein